MIGAAPFRRKAGRLHGGQVFAGGDVRRSLEHEVLEEMGEPADSWALVPGPDLVPQVHRDGGRGRLGIQEDPQPVRQPMLGEGIVDRESGHASLHTMPALASTRCDVVRRAWRGVGTLLEEASGRSSREACALGI